MSRLIITAISLLALKNDKKTVTSSKMHKACYYTDIWWKNERKTRRTKIKMTALNWMVFRGAQEETNRKTKDKWDGWAGVIAALASEAKLKKQFQRAFQNMSSMSLKFSDQSPQETNSRILFTSASCVKKEKKDKIPLLTFHIRQTAEKEGIRPLFFSCLTKRQNFKQLHDTISKDILQPSFKELQNSLGKYANAATLSCCRISSDIGLHYSLP